VSICGRPTTYRTMRECVPAACGVAWRGVARRGMRYVTRGTEHVSIRPHNGNITAI